MKSIEISLEDFFEFLESTNTNVSEFLVNTRHGYNTIEAYGVTAYDSEIIRLDFSESYVECSPCHQLWSVTDNCWKEARHWNVGELVESKLGDDVLLRSSVLPFKEDLYDIQVANVHEFYVNGLVSHNSTLLDALSFVLYKKPFRKINMGQIINSINKRDCVVECEFSTGGSRYMIRRGLKPNRLEVYKNDNLINQDASARDYQAHFEQNILKMSHHAFCQVVILGSATYTPFMQLPAYQRREVVEDLLDIQIFTSMNGILKERVARNKEGQQKVRYDIELEGERIAMQRQMLASKSEDMSLWIQEKEHKIEELAIHLDSKIEFKQSADAELGVLDVAASKLDGSIERMNKLRNIIDRVLEKTSKLHKDQSFYHDNDNCPVCQQMIGEEFRAEMISKADDDLKELEVNLPKVREKYDEAISAVEELRKLNEKIKVKERNITSLESDIRNTSDRIDELKEELASREGGRGVNNDIDGNVDVLQSHVIALSEFEKIREGLAHEGVILAAASSLLKDGGIKSQIIKQYIPVMNKLINKYLSAMDFFVQFEMDEQFSEKIKSRFRDEYTYQSFSEGEKMRINLAILFTWRAVAKMRNSASTNLLIMDEVFDSSLDTAGVDEFMKIISDLTKDTNLFVISHKGDTLADKFHSLIQFEKAGNYSRMVKAA